MEIISNNGHIFLIDKEDFADIRGYVWNAYRHRNTFYVYSYDSISRRNIYLHRYLMGFPEYQVDHRNRNGLDNRKSNLRIVTCSQQNMNRRKKVNSAFKYKGVDKRGKRFNARITCEGVQIYLGCFDTQEDAALAYNVAAKELFGEYALLNRIEVKEE